MKPHSLKKSFVILAVVLLAGVIGAFTVPPEVTTVAKIHPVLTQISANTPETKISVIVQANDLDQALAEIGDLGGIVTKDLHIINSFAVEMSAADVEELGHSPAVRWISLDAPVVNAQTGSDTLRDEFNVQLYAGSDGTRDWSATPWIETGELWGEGPTAGPVQITLNNGNCLSTSCLQIGGVELNNPESGFGIFREVDLSEAMSANLTYSYRRGSSGTPIPTASTLSLDVSLDGGVSWTTLKSYLFDGIDASQTAESFDVSAFMASNTRFRFITHGPVNDIVFYIDDIQFELTLPDDTVTPALESVSITKNVLDEFNTTSYSNDDGDAAWDTAWIEEGDGGASNTGDITVEHDACPVTISKCVEFDGDANLNASLERRIDLTNAISATLKFDYKLMGNAAVFDLVVSTDGGVNWVTVRSYQEEALVFGETIDLTPYRTAETRIAFVLVERDAVHGTRFYIDNVEIVIDEYVQATEVIPNVYLDTIDAHSVWNMGFQGQGVTIAVIDSGIDNSHLDFGNTAVGNNSRIIVEESFGQEGDQDDDYGHGTHVGGIIGGNGAMSAGFYTGVAPQVNLIDVRVSDKLGVSYISDVIYGLQWVYDNKDVHNIRVVNLSLNSTVDESYQTNPLDAAAEILWFNGIVVVVSSGNNGHDGIVYPPANDPFVITVGSADEKGTADRIDDELASYSAFGMTLDSFAKPDIVAPGHDILAALSGQSGWYDAHPTNRAPLPYDQNYFRLSGTSMAAGVASGAAALLLQAEPNLTPDQVKYRLMATAAPLSGPDPIATGAGSLDIHTAVISTTTASANTNLAASQLLGGGDAPVVWNGLTWNSVAWNSVAWNSVAWNSVAWNSVAWNSVAWNSVHRDE